MGDPKKQRSKFRTPSHPWQAKRILEEGKLVKEYGLANKKEIWKMTSVLRDWQLQARDIVGMSGAQKERASKILVDSLKNKGVLKDNSTYEDVLALNVKDVMDRRLQSVVYKKSLANSSKQARQFILHKKVLVSNKIIDSPAYLVTINDEVALIPGFVPPVVKKAQEELLKSEVIKEKRADEKTAAKKENSEEKPKEVKQ